MKRLGIVVLVSSGVFPGLAGAQAMEQASWYRDKLAVAPSIGLLSSNAGEYVYTGERKLSQLNWVVEKAPILQLDIDYAWDSGMLLYSKMWTTLQERNGTMDDYDWLIPTQRQWTDWSHHRSPLHRAVEMDVGVSLLTHGKSSFVNSLVLGYQYSRYHWSAMGGTYLYDNGTISGSDPDDELAITYSQKFSTFYLGVTTHSTYRDFTLDSLIKVGLSQINDEDEHLHRNINFKGKMEGIMVSVGLMLGYAVTPQLSINSSLNLTGYFSERGDTTLHERDKGEITRLEKNAEADNLSARVALGVRYQF